MKDLSLGKLLDLAGRLFPRGSTILPGFFLQAILFCTQLPYIIVLFVLLILSALLCDLTLSFILLCVIWN